MNENQITTQQSDLSLKERQMQRIEKQKSLLKQKEEALKQEARRIKAAEGKLKRKTRSQHIVALGLVCEQSLLSNPKNIDYFIEWAEHLKKNKQVLNGERAIEMLNSIREKAKKNKKN